MPQKIGAIVLFFVHIKGILKTFQLDLEYVLNRFLFFCFFGKQFV